TDYKPNFFGGWYIFLNGYPPPAPLPPKLLFVFSVHYENAKHGVPRGHSPLAAGGVQKQTVSTTSNAPAIWPGRFLSIVSSYQCLLKHFILILHSIRTRRVRPGLANPQWARAEMLRPDKTPA
ncbi:hypothetical protein, partial [Nitratidesulfovibrio sp. 1201_IL3209]|uniref:hypothetical protein n=1 Tax=Nitratidesulfovibrio sp. 1201_IL3209 TaxID=3084053 RepID=UPI002FDA0EB7